MGDFVFNHSCDMFHIPVLLYTFCAIFGTYFYPGVIREDAECTFQFDDSKDKPILIASRCGRLEHPENTIAAIQSSVAAQCEMIHVDCTLTQDYKVVCARNETFEDLTGIKGKAVSDYEHAKLPEMLPTIDVILPEGRIRQLKTVQSGPCYKHGKGRRMPLLESVLKAKKHKDNLVWIETHEPSRELALQIEKAIEDTGSKGKVLWSSSDPLGQKQLELQNPQRSTLFSGKELFIIYALYYFGFLPWYRPKDRGFLYLDFDVESSWKTWFLWCPSLWKHLQLRGYRTMVHVTPEKEEWSKVRSSEVWAMVTELPGRVRRHFISPE